MKLTLSNKEYTFLIGYQTEQKYRTAFNIWTKKIFGISLYFAYGDKAVGNCKHKFACINF